MAKDDEVKEGYELIVAEKPQAAAKIADALSGGREKKRSLYTVPFYEFNRNGKRVIVATTVGHIFGLKEKNKVGWMYPVFDLEWGPSYEISKSAAFTKKYFTALKKLMAGAASFVNACDLDTEGELIFRNILRLMASREDAVRMRFSTMTKEDLKAAYEEPAPHIDFGLVEAGETRHFLDFMWGVNTSRALTLAIKRAEAGFKVLSSGRVQSPVLALLVQREEEIEAFKPKPFWRLEALIDIRGQEVAASHAKEKFWKEAEAKKIHAACTGKPAVVAKVVTRQYKMPPPVPFNLTSLQTASYEHFGLSPKQTLQAAESLYLAAYISYPRTASEKLPSKIGYKQIISALAKAGFREAVDLLTKKRLKPKEGKKEDPAHVSIYPTASPPRLEDLQEPQRRLYELIVRRFLAVFGDAAVRESVNVDFEIGGETFKASGARTVGEGWLKLYGQFVRLKESTLPKMAEGESHAVKSINVTAEETKPPTRFSQGSVISEMEERGLGTKATRADILQTLYDRNYIVDKQIRITELGRQIVKVLRTYVPDLLSEELTKHFEQDMEDVQLGKKKEKEVIEEARGLLTKMLEDFKAKELEIGKGLSEALAVTRKEAAIVGKCPNCGSDLKIIRSRKSGKIFVGCSGYPKCKTAFPLPQGGRVKTTDQQCKVCKSPIVYVFTKGRRPWRLCIDPKCPTKEKKQQVETQ